MEPVIENATIRPESLDGPSSHPRRRRDDLVQSPGPATGWLLPRFLRSKDWRGAFGNAIATGPLDRRSALFAILGSLAFLAIGSFCLTLSRHDAAFASVWLPNGIAVAILLLARLRNELPLLAGVFIAGLAAHSLAGTSGSATIWFAAANLAEIVIATWLIRRVCKGPLDITDLAQMGRFLLYAGLVGPIVSTVISTFAVGADPRVLFASASSWFLANSMGLILTIPAVTLIADAVRDRMVLTRAELAERSLIMLGGLLTVYIVFTRDAYPLLFLIPPITLLMAFRLGGLGTALYVPGVAIMAIWMTYAGYGPIVQNTTSDISKMYLIQAFVSANFLTGLPIAAILAGRARMTEQLIEGRAELELLAENVTDAVLSIDPQGRCTYASQSVRAVLGREPEDFVGHLITERGHDEAADSIAAVLERLLSGERDKERMTYRRLLDADDGTPVFIEADCAVAISPETGKRGGVIVSARDVTERVELELLLTRSRTHAEHAARAKSEFLANMSHEIRTPMNGVLGFAELMLQSELSEEHRRHTEMIVQSGRSMMLLLNDILDLSKIEAGQIAIDTAPLDLYAMVADCAVLHRPVAEKKGLDLVFNGPCTGTEGCTTGCDQCDGTAPPPWIETDALRLRQIILNLIANAVKFTEKGKVEISCEVRDGEFTIEVRDTGIGISPSRIKTIFAPFTQGESDTARRFGGTGLGLTISRQLAELLGGAIEVESQPSVGSTFRLTLPAIVAQPEFTPPRETEIIKPADLPQSARILLVEDHDVNRMLGMEMLERCGQKVAIAQDGNEAIAMIIDGVMRDKPFDLVFMDIQMPGCDGYAATRAVRADGIGPDLMPIIALTANAFPEDIAEARAAGMQAHLAKPLVFADLARALQRWLPTRIVDADEGEARPFAGAEELDVAQRTHRDIPSARRKKREEDTSQTTTLVEREIASTSISGLNAPPQTLSPSLVARWNRRRCEAIEAVRSALENGLLSGTSYSPDSIDGLARLVHKLAGTAAIFGEPELGDQAAAFERALRQELPGEVREALAFELLTVADDPADTLASLAK